MQEITGLHTNASSRKLRGLSNRLAEIAERTGARPCFSGLVLNAALFTDRHPPGAALSICQKLNVLSFNRSHFPVTRYYGQLI
jgi:hypothetical protein